MSGGHGPGCKGLMVKREKERKKERKRERESTSRTKVD
jgi:hypothetical protein